MTTARPSRFLGLDPGASGGIGVITVDGAECHAWPDVEQDMYRLIEEVAFPITNQIVMPFASLEYVHAMPKQGVSSTFKFGKHYGMLVMALIALEIPYQLVPPRTWQQELRCLSRGDKNVTKVKAQQLFPGLTITHATADALLLAEYGRRTWK